MLTTPLRNEHNEEIPVAQIQVLGVPRIIEEQAIQETLVSVTVSPNTPTGNYRGFLTMWEDNNSSGTIDIGEPTDNIILSLEVAQSERPDVGIMGGDMSITADSSIGQDLAISDAEASVDGSITSEVDADIDQGQAIIGDGGLGSDASVFSDGSTSDAFNPFDQSTSTVDALTTELGIGDADTVTDLDGGIRSSETWAGKPSGGGLQCSQGTHSQFWYIGLLVCLAMGRRRC